jgi:hypothetical protein
MSILPVTHLRIYTTKEKLLSEKECPCSDCLVQMMCLVREVRPIKNTHTVRTRACDKLRDFLDRTHFAGFVNIFYDSTFMS